MEKKANRPPEKKGTKRPPKRKENRESKNARKSKKARKSKIRVAPDRVIEVAIAIVIATL